MMSNVTERNENATKCMTVRMSCGEYVEYRVMSMSNSIVLTRISVINNMKKIEKKIPIYEMITKFSLM